MINIDSKGRDRIVYDVNKVDRYGWDSKNPHTHTHIPQELFNNPNKIALRIRYNCYNNRIPRHSKFVKKHVRERNFKRYIESHIRVSNDIDYIRELQLILKKHSDTQNYVNIQKGARA
jgi:hypothetical protein